MTKLWTEDSIRDLLKSSDRAVERGILAIYARQTADEQSVGDTRHLNARGFSAAHASRGSYYARWLEKGNKLTGKHLQRARRFILHYVRQLVEIANSSS